MNDLVIVAIPSQEDYVWQISSDKVPHLTLLNLGEESGKDLVEITTYLNHVVDTTVCRFGLSVDHRGPLGPKPADVLFFDKDDTKKLNDIRSYLLTNSEINKAYNSITQYPEWVPHLTLGFPETPAKPDKRDYPGTSWINFDRIALWTGDFEGPTFRLKEDRRWEVSMSDDVDEFLSHFGIKGMKWGSRRAAKGQHIRDTISPDAKKAVESFGKLKKTGIHSLTNEELQGVVTRMNLEQQYSKIAPASKKTKTLRVGSKFASDLLVGVGKQQATKFVNDQATKLIAQAIKKK